MYCMQLICAGVIDRDADSILAGDGRAKRRVGRVGGRGDLGARGMVCEGFINIIITVRIIIYFSF